LPRLALNRQLKFLKHLREDEIESLTFVLARLDNKSSKQKYAVLKEFSELYNNNKDACFGGIEFARNILEKSIGEEKTIDIINRLTSALQVRPFDFIRHADLENLYTIIKEERPQILALILSYLGSQNASEILQKLPVQSQIEVIRRIENLKETSPEVLREIERILEKNLALKEEMDYCLSGGKETVEEILESFPNEAKKQLVDFFKEKGQSEEAIIMMWKGSSTLRGLAQAVSEEFDEKGKYIGE